MLSTSEFALELSRLVHMIFVFSALLKLNSNLFAVFLFNFYIKIFKKFRQLCVINFLLNSGGGNSDNFMT